MSKNRRGGLTGNQEWGKQARKHEDARKNLNGRARREAIYEGLANMELPPWRKNRTGEKIECPYCSGRGHDGRGTECGFCDGGVHVLGT